MKHKILLALFLCLVIIFSSNITQEDYEVVQVKNVSSNADKYTISTIKEEKEDIKIDVYYPVTKYENVNLKIMQKIEDYIEKVKNSEYVSDSKFLKISFEDFEEESIISFKFNVEYNLGLTHNTQEIFTICCSDENIIDLDYIEKQNSLNISKIKEDIKPLIQEQLNITDEELNDNEIYSNFIITNGNIVMYINKNIVSGNKSEYITIEIPNNYI